MQPNTRSDAGEPLRVAAADGTIPQDWDVYTPAEHVVWDQLFARQATMLPARVTREFMDGLDILRLSKPGIPRLDELSERLQKATGWSVHAVPGLVSDELFFEHLANRRFVAGRFIRRPEQIDYLQEPDIFHDVFGHVPLLSHPVFADYMQAYGRGGVRAMKHGAIAKLARLYWYTVEFGLVRSEGALKLYGAGLVSSHAESVFALDDPSPNRIGFRLKRVMQTRYRIDDFQQSYFVVDSYEDLLKQTLDTDFAPIYAETAEEIDIEPACLLLDDHVITLGTQRHALERERERRDR
jgi:phenylalanine-4-hydroxylase